MVASMSKTKPVACTYINNWELGGEELSLEGRQKETIVLPNILFDWGFESSLSPFHKPLLVTESIISNE